MFLFRFFVGLSDTKLHEIHLDNKEIKLSWMVDWYKQEVLFHLQNAFNEQHRWFYLGFSKRGGTGDADICFFENQNGFFNVVTDTYTSPDGKFVHKDYQQDCVLFKMDEYTLAFKRKFDTCDPSDFRMHVSLRGCCLQLFDINIVCFQYSISCWSFALLLGRHHVRYVGQR